MSTTIRQIAIWSSVLVICWIGIMAGVMRVSDAAPAAVVPFPGAELIGRLPDDTRILDLTRAALTVANAPGTTRALYDAGAWLVLPAGLSGCLPLSEAQRKQLR